MATNRWRGGWAVLVGVWACTEPTPAGPGATDAWATQAPVDTAVADTATDAAAAPERDLPADPDAGDAAEAVDAGDGLDGDAAGDGTAIGGPTADAATDVQERFADSTIVDVAVADVPAPETAAPDAKPTDAGWSDAAPADAGAKDSVMADATSDATPGAIPDAKPDAAPDAKPDATPDAKPDVPPPAPSTAFHLPFKCGTSHKCTAGNGQFHHKNLSLYGFDFSIATGTPIVAMRAGKVTAVHAPTGPGDPCYNGCSGGAGFEACCNKCLPLANWLNVQHSDATITHYGHFQKITVKLGASVAAGAQLGLAGTTGCSTGPHLHTMRMKGCPKSICQSVPLTFAEAGKPVGGQTVKSKNCP